MILVSVELLLFFVVAPAIQDNVHRNHDQMHRLHNDSDAYIAMLEDPGRDSYQKPSEVLDALAIKTGETIADIGAGSGYFSLRMAQRVGEAGLIYAVDVNPEMVRYVNRKVRDLGLQNHRSVLADPDDPLLAEDSVDRIFICDTWHHIGNQNEYLELLKKAMRPGGQVVMIDFKKKELPVGPPTEMKVSREALIDQMAGAGFKLLEEHTFLPYQYFLVFTAADN